MTGTVQGIIVCLVVTVSILILMSMQLDHKIKNGGELDTAVSVRANTIKRKCESMNQIPKDQEALEHEQLKQDKQTPSIGGTSAATITLEAMGETPPFGNSAFDVWLRLTGRKPATTEDTDRFEIGRLLEEPIATRFTRKTGLHTAKLPFLIHPEHSWATGHLDRVAVEEPADIEIKTVEWDPNHEWSDPNLGEVQRVPLSYLLQPVWYAGIPRPDNKHGGYAQSGPQIIPGLERDIYIAAQFGFKPLRIYKWKCDDTIRGIYARMFEVCQKFWEENVLKDDPPPFNTRNTKGAKEWLQHKFPVSRDQEIVEVQSQLVVDTALAYKEACEKAKSADAHKEKLSLELAKHVGASYGIRASSKDATVTVTWPTIPAWSGTVEKKAYRRLNVNVKKG